MDIFGLSRTITINGVITGTDATHVSFIDSIEAIMNGKQIGVIFVSSKTGISAKKVYLDGFDWDVQQADVSKISYSLTLIEGESVAVLP